MKFNKQNFIIQLLAFIGLALSVELCVIYYNANYAPYALSSFCSMNDFIDCDGVAKTVYSQFLGIPLCYWGILLYLTVLFLSVVDKLKNFKFFKFLEVFKNPVAYITAISTFAFLCSIILAFISLSIIKKLCLLCLFTYVIDLIIALAGAKGLFKNIVTAFKSTWKDFISGAMQYTKTFIILVIIATSFLAYSGLTLNFVPNVKKSKAIMKYRKIKYNPYRIKGNTLGNTEGNVRIELYSDYVCPLCYINNIMLHKAVKEFKNIYVIHHNYPFDKECNKYIMVNMHPGACFMSRGAIAARNQNNYWEMSSLLYEKQPKSMNDMLKLADELGFDKVKFESDINSPKTLDEILSELDKGQQLNFDATPTMVINGDVVVGVKPYYELKEILEKHGARK